jgi:hypothetical protein
MAMEEADPERRCRNFTQFLHYKASQQSSRATTWNGMDVSSGWVPTLSCYYTPAPMGETMDHYGARGVLVSHTGRNGTWLRSTPASPADYADVPDRAIAGDRLGTSVFTPEGPRLRGLGRVMLSFEQVDTLNASVQASLGYYPQPPTELPPSLGTAMCPVYNLGRPVYQPGFQGAFPAYCGPVFDTPVVPTLFYEGEAIKARGSGVNWVHLSSAGQVIFEGEIILHADGSIAVGPDGRLLRWSDYLCPACMNVNHDWASRCYSCTVCLSPFLTTIAQDPTQLPPSNEWWMSVIRLWRARGGFKGVAQPTSKWVTDQRVHYGDAKVASLSDRYGRLAPLGEDLVPNLARPETPWVGRNLPGTCYEERDYHSADYLVPGLFPSYAGLADAFHPGFAVLGEYTAFGPTSGGKGRLRPAAVLTTRDMIGAANVQQFYRAPRFVDADPTAMPDLRREYDLPVFWRRAQPNVQKFVQDMSRWRTSGYMPTAGDVARNRHGWNSRQLPVVDKSTLDPSLPGAVNEGYEGPVVAESFLVPPRAAEYLAVNLELSFTRYVRAFQVINAGVLDKETVEELLRGPGGQFTVGPRVDEMFEENEAVAFPKAYLGTTAISQERFFQPMVLQMRVLDFHETVWPRQSTRPEADYQYFNAGAGGLEPTFLTLLEGHDEDFPAAVYFINRNYVAQHRNQAEVEYLIPKLVTRKYESWLEVFWPPKVHVSHGVLLAQILARLKEAADAGVRRRTVSLLATVPADLRALLGPTEADAMAGLQNRGSRELRLLRQSNAPVPMAPQGSRRQVDAAGEDLPAQRRTYFFAPMSETEPTEIHMGRDEADSVWSDAVTEASETPLWRPEAVNIYQGERPETVTEEPDEQEIDTYEDDYLPQASVIDELSRTAQAATVRAKAPAPALEDYQPPAKAPPPTLDEPVPCRAPPHQPPASLGKAPPPTLDDVPIKAPPATPSVTSMALVPTKAPPAMSFTVPMNQELQDPWMQTAQAKLPPFEITRGYYAVFVGNKQIWVRRPTVPVMAPWGQAPIAEPIPQPHWWHQLEVTDLPYLPADIAKEWAAYRRVNLRFDATLPPVMISGAVAIEFLYDATGRLEPYEPWVQRGYRHAEAAHTVGWESSMLRLAVANHWVDPADHTWVPAPEFGAAFNGVNTADRWLPSEPHPLHDSADGPQLIREAVLMEMYPFTMNQVPPSTFYVDYDDRMAHPLHQGFPPTLRLDRRWSTPRVGNVDILTAEGTGYMTVATCSTAQVDAWFTEREIQGAMARGPGYARDWPVAPARAAGHVSWGSTRLWQDVRTEWVTPGSHADGDHSAVSVRALFALCEHIYPAMLDGGGNPMTSGTLPEGHLFVYGQAATPLRQAPDTWVLAQAAINPSLLGRYWAVEFMRYLAQAPNDIEAGIVGIPRLQLVKAFFGVPGLLRNSIMPEVRVVQCELHWLRVVPPENQRPHPVMVTRVLRIVDIIADTEAPKSVAGESFMPGPCRLSVSTAHFIARHEWWVQNRTVGLRVRSTSGLVYLVMPPLMAPCVPRTVTAAWQGGVSTFAPMPAPGLWLLPVIQIMAPLDYNVTEEIYEQMRAAVKAVMTDKSLRTFSHQLRYPQRTNTMPMMTRIRLREATYLTETGQRTTLVLSNTVPLSARLDELRRQLSNIVKRTTGFRTQYLAPTVHAP